MRLAAGKSSLFGDVAAAVLPHCLTAVVIRRSGTEESLRSKGQCQTIENSADENADSTVAARQDRQRRLLLCRKRLTSRRDSGLARAFGTDPSCRHGHLQNACATDRRIVLIGFDNAIEVCIDIFIKLLD